MRVYRQVTVHVGFSNEGTGVLKEKRTSKPKSFSWKVEARIGRRPSRTHRIKGTPEGIPMQLMWSARAISKGEVLQGIVWVDATDKDSSFDFGRGELGRCMESINQKRQSSNPRFTGRGFVTVYNQPQKKAGRLARIWKAQFIRRTSCDAESRYQRKAHETEVISDMGKWLMLWGPREDGEIICKQACRGFFSKKHSLGMGSSSRLCQLCLHYISSVRFRT